MFLEYSSYFMTESDLVHPRKAARQAKKAALKRAASIQILPAIRSPISEQDAFLQPSCMISPVRQPSFKTKAEIVI